MNKYTYLLILLLATSASLSCATAPSQDDDLVIYGEEPEGPGVFSGETGEIILFKDNDESTNTNDIVSGDSGASPGMSSKDWQEFSAFKRWLNSKQIQDENYQEFQLWLKYEEYRQWQESL